MELSVDLAIEEIIKKDSSTGKKIRNPFNCHQYMQFTDLTEDIRAELEEARSTSILRSCVKDRRQERRNAVCERSHIEAILVKKILTLYVQGNMLSEYNLN